jgi:acetyl esterase/lipase
MDILSSKCLIPWGSQVIGPVPESQHVYLEAIKAPESWFAGIDGLVDRLLITTGSKECLRDDDVALAELLRKHHRDLQMVVEKDGVHDGPLFDFAVGDPKLGGEVKTLMVEWLSAGMGPR